MVEEADPTKPNEENPNPIKSKDLQYVFQPGRDHFPAKPYYDDGNPSMYTQENIKAREALRTHPNVKAGIENFMKNFRKEGSKGMISKDEYCRVFIKVGQILRPGIDTDELAKIIREDFDSDCQEKKKSKKEGEENEAEEQDAPPRHHE